VALNVTVTQPTAAGFVTAWPTGAPRPLASNLNFVAGQTVPNAVVVKLGTGGRVSLYNDAGSAHLIADVSGYYTSSSELVPVDPVRLLDTRSGAGGVSGSTWGTVQVQAAGRVGLPATGLTSVVMNVTVTQPASAGFLTVWPSGSPRPNASNLNFASGQTVPNLVIAKLGPGGAIAYNSSARTHVIIDILGYVRSPQFLTAELDQVDAFGGWREVAPIQVQGTTRWNSLRGSQISTTPRWVEYNLGREWGTLATTMSYDDDLGRAGDRARFRILGDGIPLIERTLTFGEAAEVTADVAGVLRVRLEVTSVITGKTAYAPVFADPTLVKELSAGFPSPQQFTALVPKRVLDTRDGTGAGRRVVPQGGAIDLQLLGTSDVPRSGVGAVVLNVTVTQPSASGYITVWPSGKARPNASNLNFTPRQDVPNLVIVPVGANGRVSLFNGSPGGTHLIADILGWYPGSASIAPGSVFLTAELDQVDAFGGWREVAPIQVQGTIRWNSLGGSQISTTPRWVEYNLGRQWGTLATTMSYDDDLGRAGDRARFRILGDGIPLIERTLTFGEAAEVTADVAGVLRVRLEVTSVITGKTAYAPVFADPTLVR
jgi:hypothetical protein